MIRDLIDLFASLFEMGARRANDFLDSIDSAICAGAGDIDPEEEWDAIEC